MKRRKFIQSSLILTLTAAATGAGCVNPFETKEEKLTRLLSYVHQDSFKTLASGQTFSSLHSKLLKLGVISESGDINTETIQNLALTDNMVAHNGFYYTQTEIDLYTMAYLSKQA